MITTPESPSLAVTDQVSVHNKPPLAKAVTVLLQEKLFPTLSIIEYYSCRACISLYNFFLCCSRATECLRTKVWAILSFIFYKVLIYFCYFLSLLDIQPEISRPVNSSQSDIDIWNSYQLFSWILNLLKISNGTKRHSGLTVLVLFVQWTLALIGLNLY